MRQLRVQSSFVSGHERNKSPDFCTFCPDEINLFCGEREIFVIRKCFLFISNLEPRISRRKYENQQEIFLDHRFGESPALFSAYLGVGFLFFEDTPIMTQMSSFMPFLPGAK